MYKTKIKAWGLIKYKKRRRTSHWRSATFPMASHERTGLDVDKRLANLAGFTAAQRAPYKMKDVPITCALVAITGPPQSFGFDQQIDDFLRATVIYLQFAAKQESWRSTPSLLVPTRSCRNRITSRRTQAVLRGPVLEWSLNAFHHKNCGQQSFFFDDIVRSICYAARADYRNAGDCWRSAFCSVEIAIDREDPEFLVALMWSVTFLAITGCGEVVSILQNYISHLILLRAERSDPLLPVLASFAKIYPTRMIWLRGVILELILEWSTALSREDPTLFKVYCWSSLPGADGAMSIALINFMDFKRVVGSHTGSSGLDGTTYAGERLIFLARRKQGKGTRLGQDE